jgi:hypothetical protein
LHKAKLLPKEEFQRDVEKELPGKDSEPHELIYFKVYKSQIPVIEQAIETAALMLGSDKSCGYCLAMICADFLAGGNLDSGQPEVLLHSLSRFFQFLPGEQRQAFVQLVTAKMLNQFLQKQGQSGSKIANTKNFATECCGGFLAMPAHADGGRPVWRIAG